MLTNFNIYYETKNKHKIFISPTKINEYITKTIDCRSTDNYIFNQVLTSFDLRLKIIILFLLYVSKVRKINKFIINYHNSQVL